MKIKSFILMGLFVFFTMLAPSVDAVGASSCVVTSDKSEYKVGDDVKLSWVGYSTSYATISNGSSKYKINLPSDKLSSSGSIEVTASAAGSPVIVLEVFDYYGSSNACSTTFKVVETDDDENEKPEIKSLRASKTYYGNGSYTGWNVFWEVENAQRCIFKGGSKKEYLEEEVGTNDSIDVFPGSRTTFTLWCANDDGTGKDGYSTSKTIRLDGVELSSDDDKDEKDEDVQEKSDDSNLSVDEQIKELQSMIISLIMQLIALINAQN